MNSVWENICVTIMFIFAVCLCVWIRYKMADGVVECMFDYSPRTCAIVYRKVK